jgi:glycerol-3-phosphate dehydrogenase
VLLLVLLSLWCCGGVMSRREYCVRVEDFLARRTRLAFLDVNAAEAAVNKVSSRGSNSADRAATGVV